MKCPVCIIAGKKSKVFSVVSTCVTMEIKPDQTFYDEEGNYHNHNHSKWGYRCSNEHIFNNITHCEFGDCCEEIDK